MSNTSWQVKDRYNKKHYKRIVADLPIELVEAFKSKCKAEGVSQAEVIKNALEKFVKEE